MNLCRDFGILIHVIHVFTVLISSFISSMKSLEFVWYGNGKFLLVIFNLILMINDVILKLECIPVRCVAQ